MQIFLRWKCGLTVHVLSLMNLFAPALANSCSCTGQGFGSDGLTRGFPTEYGSACKAWDDGDCSAHTCGTVKLCDRLWPDTPAGTWCCKAWCYVDPNTCKNADVQPSTIADSSKKLYYSYSACQGRTVKYTADTCPWQKDTSFAQASAAIVVAERISELISHDESGVSAHGIVETYTGDEVAVTAGNDAKLCVFKLRAYGGTRTFCSSPLADPVKSMAITPYVAITAKEGAKEIIVWKFQGDTTLQSLGTKVATVQPIQYMKYISRFGLLISSEDGYVYIWDVAQFTSAPNVAASSSSGHFGAFNWAPGALEAIEFAGKHGVAVADYADIKLWTNDGSWRELTRLSGHSRLVVALSFLPSLGLLASASLDSVVGLWHYSRGQWMLATYLHDHVKPVTSALRIPQGPLLATGDEDSMILWRPATSSICEFEFIRSYYLAGFNKYKLEGKSVDECQKFCCENAWCISFDYGRRGDKTTHGDRTCFLSGAAEGREGGGGLVYDKTGNYDYYEVKKRGTRFMTLEQPKGIGTLAVGTSNGVMVSNNLVDGVLDVWKISSSSCPDGQMAKGDGASCILCPLGRAGKGGLCPACAAGTISVEEGLRECTPCPRGKYMPAVGGLKCLDCEAGKFADSPSTAQCTECAPGTFSAKIRATENSTCTPCKPGTYATQFASSECTACPAGKSHDQYAGTNQSDCTTCTLCGTVYADGSPGACTIPKDSACQNCPVGMVFNDASSCQYCPQGEFPDGSYSGCNKFTTGPFDAVLDINNRKCYNRSMYKNFKCPLQENLGWGSNGYAKNTRTRSYEFLSDAENQVCSALHCMGAFYELAEIVNRQNADSSCPVDDTLRDLCKWTKDLLNSDLNKREEKANKQEADLEFENRLGKCSELCSATELCKQVTEEEAAKETAFDVLPFVVQSSGFRGLRCYAKCLSERPPKTVEKVWDCMSHRDVSSIVVPRTKIPRCQASCTSCPSGTWKSASFQECNERIIMSSSARDVSGLRSANLLWIIVLVRLLAWGQP